MDNLLCDSDHDRIDKLRKLVANQKVKECASPAMLVYLRDLEFVLRYVGELEDERWSFYHG